MALPDRHHKIETEKVMATPPTRPLPFTVLGGFLGAGKTTLLNRLLTESKQTRFAVLVNDFGELNIDEHLVTQHDGETIALANGCMCCSMANGFVSALTTVMDRSSQFDHVVVEASGVSNPRRIMDIATLEPGLTPNGSIVLVDTPQLLSQLDDPLIEEAVITQIKEADIIVINKIGLTDDITIAGVKRTINTFNPDCSTIANDRDDFQPGLLFGGDNSFNLSTVPAPKQSGPTELGANHHHQHGDDYFRSYVLRQNSPLDRATFDRWAEALPCSVIRGKGFITFTDSPKKHWLWQKVGHSTVLESDHTADGAVSAVVLIGPRSMPTIENLEITGPFSKD